MARSDYKQDSVTNRTAVGAGWMIAWRLITRGLGFISTLILARLLVPADFGVVAVATALAASIESLSELGLQAALVRRPDNDHSLYDTAFTMQAVRGLITGTILAAGAWTAGNLFGDPRLSPVLFVLAGVAAIAGFDNIAVVGFQRELRFDLEFRLLFVPRILQFVATTTVALTFHSYWALIVGVVVGRVARTGVTYWIRPYHPRLSLSRWRDLAGFSFWSWASSMAYMVWNRCDAFILGPALSMGELGIFMLAMEIGLLPTTELVEPATRALYAGVSAAQNRGTDAIGLALPLMAALQMVVLPVGLGISATSSYVVAGLLGPAWVSGTPVIAIFSALALITPITYVCTTVLNAAGHVRQNFLAIAGAATMRVVAVYAVAGYRRLDWAAIAICCVVAGESLLLVFQLGRRGHLQWRKAAPGAIRTAAACSCIGTLLWTTGIGWQATDLPWAEALATGSAIGAACIASCFTLQLIFWLWLGRPAGPEATFLTVVNGFVTYIRREAVC